MTINNLSKHWGLYTPREPLSPSEHVQCTNIVGILTVIAGNTPKMLSFTVLFRHHTTVRAYPGGVGRRHEHKTNTVLLSFVLDPVEYLPVCPWSHGFSEISTSVFSLSPFHVIKIFNTENLHVLPGKFINNLIYIVGTFFIALFARLRTRFSFKNFISDIFKISSKKSPGRISYELINSYVYPKCLSFCFQFCVWAFHPDGTEIFRKTNALYKLSSRHGEPFIDRSRLSGRDDYFMPFSKTTEFQNEIKGFISSFYRNKLSIQDSGACVNGKRTGFTESFGRLFCADNYFKSLLKSLRFISLRKSGVLETIKSFFVQFPWFLPKGFNVEINGSSIGLKESIDSSFLFSSDETERDFTGTFHKLVKMKYLIMKVDIIL
jgi:hypothetical protein